MNTKLIWSVAIDTHTLYDDDSLVRGLHISQGAITAARRSGALRSIRIGTRTLYLGSAILEWLASVEAAQTTKPSDVAQNAGGES